MEGIRSQIFFWTDVASQLYSDLYQIGKLIAGVPQDFFRDGPAFWAVRQLVGFVPEVSGFAGEVESMHFQRSAMDAIDMEESLLMI